MRRSFFTALAVLVSAVAVLAQAPKATQPKSPRAFDGHPDFQGMWNAATITPLERSAEFAGKLTISEAAAAAWAQQFLDANSLDRREGGPERDRSRAYPNYFVDRGTQLSRVDNSYRTSLVI